MHRFYTPDIATTLELPPDEAAHAVRVLRLREGDTIEAVDGRGTLFSCRITAASPKRCAVEILGSETAPPHWGCRIVIAIAPTKMMERMEWMAEKCTEVGIDRIIPIRCHNSERIVVKTERLERIVIAAMKQSLKAVKPQIDPMTPIADVIAMPFTGRRYIAYCDPTLPREQRRSLAQAYLAALTTPFDAASPFETPAGATFSASAPFALASPIDATTMPLDAALSPLAATPQSDLSEKSDKSDHSDLSDHSDHSDYSDHSEASAHSEQSEKPARGDALILIGPEGDFSDDEVAAALAAGFIPVTLGQSRLRTETAALAATLTLHTLLQAQPQL